MKVPCVTRLGNRASFSSACFSVVFVVGWGRECRSVFGDSGLRFVGLIVRARAKSAQGEETDHQCRAHREKPLLAIQPKEPVHRFLKSDPHGGWRDFSIWSIAAGAGGRITNNVVFPPVNHFGRQSTLGQSTVRRTIVRQYLRATPRTCELPCDSYNSRSYTALGAVSTVGLAHS